VPEGYRKPLTEILDGKADGRNNIIIVVISIEKAGIVSMEPETTDRQPRTLGKIAIHALTGAIIGLLFALIPLSFAWGSDSFQTIHIILSIGFAVLCGILSKNDYVQE
jgi:hypothetical protein